jgi:hypothetical protein
MVSYVVYDMTIPGMVALLGWNPFCYGHLGKGSVHPSLDALVGVGLEGLELMIDFLFSFHEQGARPPPMLMLDGELRPLLHAALATMLMYYHERFLNSEMHHVLICMREAYSRTLGTPGEDAHSKLIEWGLAIRLKFDIDNLHLTGMEGHSGTEKTVQAVKQLGSSVASQRLALSDVAARQVRIESKLDVLIGLLSSASCSALPASARADAVDVAAAVVEANATAAAVSASATVAATAATTAASTSAAATPPPPSLPRFSSALPRSSSLPAGGLSSDAQYSLNKRGAGRFFIDCMKLGGRLPQPVQINSRVRAAAQRVLDAYKAMATVEEMAVLRDSQQQALVIMLTAL